MIAVIAGKGFLPLEAIKKLKAENKSFFVISLFPDNKQTLEEHCNQIEIIAQDFYKVGTILSMLKERNTEAVVLVGKVEKNLILKNLKFDWLALKLLASLITKSDREILEAIVSFLENEGIKVLKQSDIVNSLLMPPGLICGAMSDCLQKNIDFGIKIAQTISQCDVGQTVVVKDRIVLAIEAIEGTDECIRRGIELGKDNVIICKAARNDQNKKFDLPTLGPASIKNIILGQVAAIAWQSSQTLILQQDEFIKKSKELGITLISV